MPEKPSRAPSRRRFLRTAGAGGASLIAPAWGSAQAETVDPRLARVMASTIGIDMHNHVYPPGTEPHAQGGPPPQMQEQPGPGLLIAEELKRSGLTAVCAACKAASACCIAAA